jgi:threonylcarbamoyladenosine tRNA methylthiotransferase MtaB
MEELLKRSGYKIVGPEEQADLTIINSCTVTNQAAAKTRSSITSARKQSPEGKIAVIGCYAQALGDKLLKFENVDLGLGNVNKYQIIDYIKKLEKEKNFADVKDIENIAWTNSTSTFFDEATIADGRRTRANLKIQEGCNYFCSYCIIPYLRGAPRSRDYKSCIREARELEANNYKEIVLTGINIGTYAHKGKRLTDLIQGLLKETELERIRISSIEPDLIDDRLIELIENEQRLCRHLHIPLQHGSNTILKKMNRRYSFEDYARLVKKIANKIPGICLGSDIMTGFPGESEKAFQEMVNNLNELPISHYHVFRYSPKEGTRAEEFSERVPSREVKSRAKIIRNLGHNKKQDFIKQFKGKIVNVLTEKINKNNIMSGYTDNFIRVNFQGDKKRLNEILPVRITQMKNETLKGELVGG